MSHYTVLTGVEPHIELFYQGVELDDALFTFFQVVPDGRSVKHSGDTLMGTDPKTGLVAAMLIGITEREWAMFCFDAIAHVVLEQETKH